MKRSLRFNVCAARLLYAAETSKMKSSAIYSNDCFPAVSRLSNALHLRLAAFVDSPLVLSVCGLLNIAEIGKAIVGAISVYVVNNLCWPMSKDIEPCKPVRPVAGAINLDNDVWSWQRASWVSSLGSAGPINQPSELACLRIVVDDIAQTLCSKIGLSHDAPQMLIGQRPAGVDSTFAGLAIFA
jgi:hypothetical protein